MRQLKSSGRTTARCRLLSVLRLQRTHHLPTMDSRMKNILIATLGLLGIQLGYDLVYAFSDFDNDAYIHAPLSAIYYISKYAYLGVIGVMALTACKKRWTTSFFVAFIGFCFSVVIIELIAIIIAGSYYEYYQIKTFAYSDIVKWLCFVVLFIFSYVKNK